MTKFPEILDYKEKRAFIETLLIVAGILTAFNQDIVSTFPILIFFIVASLLYIVRISIMDKKIPSKIKKHNSLLSAMVAAGFSGLMIVIGAPVFGSYVFLFIGPILAIVLYATLAYLLYLILCTEKENDTP